MSVRSPWQRLRKSPRSLLGAALVVFAFASAFVGPFFAPFDPNEQFANALDRATGLPLGPSAVHWLGSDQVGRDELSRLLAGGSVSLSVALAATALATLIGTLIGVSAGYFGKYVDDGLMRVVDVLLSLPFLLIVIALHRVIDSPSTWLLAVILGGLSWTTMARVVRARTQQVTSLEYVTAARALGMSETRIVLRHVVPNVLTPVVVIATSLVAQMVIAESAMSFLGLGVTPPTSSWGSMLNDAQGLMSHAPRLMLLPSALIFATVFGFNLLGEGMRDAFDPRD